MKEEQARAQGLPDVTSPAGLVGFTEVGSGVLISADGKVMTAAHVTQALDDVTVEFIGGETVRARTVAEEVAHGGQRGAPCSASGRCRRAVAA